MPWHYHIDREEDNCIPAFIFAAVLVFAVGVASFCLLPLAAVLVFPLGVTDFWFAAFFPAPDLGVPNSFLAAPFLHVD